MRILSLVYSKSTLFGIKFLEVRFYSLDIDGLILRLYFTLASGYLRVLPMFEKRFRYG